MKKIVLLLFVSSLLCSCIWSSRNSEREVDMQIHEAIILERSVFEKSIALQKSQPVIKSGKIYIFEDLMFVNDVNKGFHVYDYKDPKKPVKIFFINAPGATDLLIKNNIIYINQAVDLVTLTFDRATEKLNVVNRISNTFPQKNDPKGFSQVVGANEIIIDWKLKQ